MFSKFRNDKRKNRSETTANTSDAMHSRGMKWVASVLSVAVIAAMAMVGTQVAQAADGDPNFLRISKTVDGLKDKTLEPGQSFTYKIQLNCSEQNCVNAKMDDLLPAALQGFKINNLEMTPASAGAVATWSEDGNTVGSTPTTVGDKTGVSVAFNQSFNGGTGLSVGTTAYINITLQVPSDFSPDDPRNNTDIVNTAKSSADNSAPGQSDATVRVSVKQHVATGINKQWTQPTANFEPGGKSQIALTSTNTSNISVDKLIVQEPQASAAADGAEALDDNNPFRTNDFAGFDANTTKPAGADTVQVDAYVLKDGTWQWVTGTPSTDFVLPDGVTNSQVGGLRFTYAGNMKPGAADSVNLNLTQR